MDYDNTFHWNVFIEQSYIPDPLLQSITFLSKKAISIKFKNVSNVVWYIESFKIEFSDGDYFDNKLLEEKYNISFSFPYLCKPKEILNLVIEMDKFMNSIYDVCIKHKKRIKNIILHSSDGQNFAYNFKVWDIQWLSKEFYHIEVNNSRVQSRKSAK
jgi:hypothetical protein